MGSKLTERQRNLRQIPFRLHVNDHQALKVKATNDKLNIQTIVESCVLAYLDGDEYVQKLARQHKVLNTVNRRKLSHSPREQSHFLDEIESLVNNGGDDA